MKDNRKQHRVEVKNVIESTSLVFLCRLFHPTVLRTVIQIDKNLKRVVTNKSGTSVYFHEEYDAITIKVTHGRYVEIQATWNRVEQRLRVPLSQAKQLVRDTKNRTRDAGDGFWFPIGRIQPIGSRTAAGLYIASVGKWDEFLCDVYFDLSPMFSIYSKFLTTFRNERREPNTDFNGRSSLLSVISGFCNAQKCGQRGSQSAP